MNKFLLYELVFVLFVSFCSFQNTNTQTAYTREQITTFIREVFVDQADVLVLNSTSGRFELIEKFLYRFKMVNQPQYAEKKYPLLSSLPLLNKYNPNLSRDRIVNPNTFNPLKYHFPMVSKKKEIYRVDNTDYVIIIEPIK